MANDDWSDKTPDEILELLGAERSPMTDYVQTVQDQAKRFMDPAVLGFDLGLVRRPFWADGLPMFCEAEEATEPELPRIKFEPLSQPIVYTVEELRAGAGRCNLIEAKLEQLAEALPDPRAQLAAMNTGFHPPKRKRPRHRRMAPPRRRPKRIAKKIAKRGGRLHFPRRGDPPTPAPRPSRVISRGDVVVTVDDILDGRAFVQTEGPEPGRISGRPGPGRVELEGARFVEDAGPGLARLRFKL